MYDEVIKLVSQTKGTDARGNITVVETEKQIFAELKSVTQSEFYQAQAAGLKPEIKFVIADYFDYAGEKVVRYRPYGSSVEEEYSVLRTYRQNDTLEIICKRGVDR